MAQHWVKELQAAVAHGDRVAAAYDTGLRELLAYLSSPKFQGDDDDYVHVRTDMVPRLHRLLMVPAEVEAEGSH